MEMPSSDDSAMIRDQALTWFVRLHAGDATASDRADFERGLATGAAQQRAYAELTGLWTELDRLPDPRPSADVVRRLRARPTRRQMLAGGAALAASIGAVTLTSLPDALTSDHHTGRGELGAFT